MTTTATHQTTIEAHPTLPTVTITREFDAPVDRVYRAWVEPELVKRWLGPNNTEMDLLHWDIRTGGSYRYTAAREGEEIARFYGSIHEARPNERLVQTFTWEGYPDGVALDTATFEDLGDGRSRVTIVSLFDSLESRDMTLASGMDVGVNEGYAKLDALLAEE